MSRPIHVINAIGRLEVGGSQRRLLDVLRHLDPDEVRFDFLVFDGEPGALDEEALRAGATIYRCPGGRAFPRAFSALLRQERPDVVHAHTHYAAGLVMLLADRAGVPMRITHFRSSHDGKGSSFRREAQRRLMRRWIDAHSTDVLAVSRNALDDAWGRHRDLDDRCQVVYNGVDVEVLAHPTRDRAEVRGELGIDPAALVVVQVGRFHAVKNHLRLLEVFSVLRSREPDAVLVLVGDGPPAQVDEVRARARSLGLSDAVRFTGARDDVVDLLHAVDVLALPSLWEGLPGVVIEACTARLPVVASDLPSVREIARHLPGVTVLSLDEDDDRWAGALLDAGRTPLDERAGGADAVAASPFAMDLVLERLTDIWSGRRALPPAR